MLSNNVVITLDNGGTPSTVTFDRVQDFNNNRSVYMAASHTPLMRHTLGFTTTTPKRSGKFLGAMKAAVKVTKDLSVADASGLPYVTPGIGNVEFSLPVGCLGSDIDMLLDHMEAILKQEDTRALIKRQLLRSEY